jgi:hypothetical protein
MKEGLKLKLMLQTHLGPHFYQNKPRLEKNRLE